MRHEVVDLELGLDRPRRPAVLALFSLRPVHAQHTLEEEQLLARYAQGQKTLVEIGVAEGGSAAVLRRVMDPGGVLHLVDPYPPGKVPGLSFAKLVAHRYVGSVKNARVEWLQDFSFNASRGWRTPIDFLFIDGDHTYEAVLRDWREWSPHVREGGLVAFHDAALFEHGWTREDWGSVRAVREIFEPSAAGGWRIIDGVHSLVIARRGG